MRRVLATVLGWLGVRLPVGGLRPTRLRESQGLHLGHEGRALPWLCSCAAGRVALDGWTGQRRIALVVGVLRRSEGILCADVIF